MKKRSYKNLWIFVAVIIFFFIVLLSLNSDSSTSNYNVELANSDSSPYKIEFIVSKDSIQDTMKEYANKRSENINTDYYGIFVTSKEYARFPKNPIMAMDFPTDQAKNILAIYYKNKETGKVDFDLYDKPDSWKDIALSDTVGK